MAFGGGSGTRASGNPEGISDRVVSTNRLMVDVFPIFIPNILLLNLSQINILIVVNC